MSQSIHDLTPEELQTLATKAIDAKATAYCPYSNFRVGSSLLLTSGVYFSGANVEVASTPVGICAERCALAPAVASMKRPDMPQIRALAVSTDISPPASPCGMCRQFIREFCAPSMPIYMYDKHDKSTMKTIGELLPMAFARTDRNGNNNIKAAEAGTQEHTSYYDNAGKGSGIAGGQRRPEDDEMGEWVVDEHGSLQAQV